MRPLARQGIGGPRGRAARAAPVLRRRHRTHCRGGLRRPFSVRPIFLLVLSALPVLGRLCSHASPSHAQALTYNPNSRNACLIVGRRACAGNAKAYTCMQAPSWQTCCACRAPCRQTKEVAAPHLCAREYCLSGPSRPGHARCASWMTAGCSLWSHQTCMLGKACLCQHKMQWYIWRASSPRCAGPSTRGCRSARSDGCWWRTGAARSAAGHQLRQTVIRSRWCEPTKCGCLPRVRHAMSRKCGKMSICVLDLLAGGRRSRP